MSSNYQKNDTDISTLFAKYTDTNRNSIAGAIMSPTKTVSNFQINGTDMANTFVKFSDLAPNNMKGTQGSAIGFVSNAYTGDLGTNLVVKDTIEYLLRVQLDGFVRTTNPVSQVWSILTGSAVFGYVNLIFTSGQSTLSNITSKDNILISVSPNTLYSYYLTPYTSGGVATSNSNTISFYTPPTKPTISGSTSVIANKNGSATSFTFAGTYDYVWVYYSDGNLINTTKYTTEFSLPTKEVKTTIFYVVPFDKGTNAVNTDYKSSQFTFTVSEGTADLGTTTSISISAFTINLSGTGIDSVTGTANSGTTINGSVSNNTSATIGFSSLSTYTSYSVSVLVTFLSGNTKTLTTSVKTLSNVVVGSPSVSDQTPSAFKVTVSATNTSGVSDGTNAYTQSGNDWYFTYSGLNAGTSYTKSLTITGSDNSTQTTSVTATTSNPAPVVGTPVVSGISSSGFTVTISATNTASVKDGTKVYTQSGNDWSYSYTGSSPDTQTNITIAITGIDGSTSTKDISQYTQPTITGISISPTSVTADKDGNVTTQVTVTGVYSSYRLSNNANSTMVSGITSSSSNYTFNYDGFTNINIFAIAFDRSVGAYINNSNDKLATLTVSAYVAPPPATTTESYVRFIRVTEDPYIAMYTIVVEVANIDFFNLRVNSMAYNGAGSVLSYNPVTNTNVITQLTFTTPFPNNKRNGANWMDVWYDDGENVYSENRIDALNFIQVVQYW